MISVVVTEFRYGPRTYWKGFLRLSLVSCPIALYPATSEREKIHFHQLNRKTGNRIQYKKVDAETGREVDRDDIIKGYEKSKGDYVPVEPEKLEAVAIESKRVIEIDEFVPRKASPLHIALVYFASETMENTVRLFFLLAGHAFLVLAIAGVFLPILPTTPFVIAASWCYMRSSKRIPRNAAQKQVVWSHARKLGARQEHFAAFEDSGSRDDRREPHHFIRIFQRSTFCDDFRFHRVRRCIAIHPHEAEPAKIAA